MLLAFSVANFRSIRDLQTLNLEEPRVDEHLQASNTFEVGKKRLLKSVALFGPNAAGKSNVLRALVWFRDFVRDSARESQAGDPIETTPFLLDARTENEPSHFEIEFLLEEHEYRYGFRADTQRVHAEWLFRKKFHAGKAAKLFTREGAAIEVSDEFFKEGKGLEERARPNALFLSVCAQLNGPEATKVMEWTGRIRFVTGLDDRALLRLTADQMKDDAQRIRLMGFAQRADLGIRGMRSEDREVDFGSGIQGIPKRFPKSYIKKEIKLAHDKRDSSGQVAGQVEFDLERDESQGTKKFVALSGPLFTALETGGILVIDEFEARLHPRLTQAILDLFHGATNRHNAQLLCATHDVSLLEPVGFRRDQLGFCEKEESGATRLYSLAEFDPKEVRANTRFSRQYLLGLFGAVPRLAHLHEAVADSLSHAREK